MNTVEVVNVQMLYLLLLIGALLCFILAVLGVKAVRPINWVALGLGLWVLVAVIQMAQRV